MSEIVERVAAAIERTTHDDDASFEEAWRDHEIVRHNRMIEARAAIAAIREPTEAMIVAGVHHDNMGDMAGRWRAMVDAALADEPMTEPTASSGSHSS